MGNKKLILVRHAKSAWNTPSKSDYDRPLNARGRRDAPIMAQWLVEEVGHLDYIISSPALRAKQTALCLARSFKDQPVHWDQGLYCASAQYLRTAVALAFKLNDMVALVGHNPGIEACLQHYCLAVPVLANGKIMTTANMALIEFEAGSGLGLDVPQASGKLVVLRRPKDV